MIKSKLYQMLQTFDKDDWKGFEKFVRSPYFNTGEKSIQLFDYLKEKFWTHQSTLINKKEIALILFENETYHDAYFRVIISTLTQLLEKYLIQKEMESQTLYQEHFLRKGLLKRGLFKQYEQQRKQEVRINNKLEEQQQLKKGVDYYLSQYFSSMDDFKFLQLKKARSIPIEVVEESIKYLDEFFLINRLHLMNSHLSIQRNLKIERNIPFLAKIHQMVLSKMFHDNLLIQSYFSGLQLFLHPDAEDWFNKIEEQIEREFSTIPKQELNEFYTIIINQYIRKASQSSSYYAKVLALYKLMAQYNFLCSEQYITPGKYKNIVTLGCHFQEFDWTKTFIEKYKNRLNPTHQESIYNLNLGTFYFSQQQFEKARYHLIAVDSFDIYYAVDARSLLLRIYYETQQYFAIVQAAPSFKDFIRKQKKFTTAFKQSYVRFINILVKLTKLSQEYAPTQNKKIQLLEKIDRYPSIYFKEWLVKKINQW